ncbi:hypothetical protein [Alkalihalobacillus sp. AL-G]|uniref:hypothetical protein n=1 Tax=Alkalihalobacillus sp. AL-G TaxID=2926399 RepID=UPI00272A13A1|nr:hypothetical protein [Alkalihalobacillus sp. AL-G]WLD91764.1 hypothetical protein MOJ78_12015 [Alkalihalobacillus sp. AL-G]
MEHENKTLPNDKKTLLDTGGYEMHNRALSRKVFPRIIRESNEVNSDKRNKPQIRDVVAFYYLLLDHVSGEHTHKDGNPNDRFGACWLSYSSITELLQINRGRVKSLADILEANGLITREKVARDMRQTVLYYPSYASRVSEDGYIVNEDGEKVVPDPKIYKPKPRKKVR